MTYNLVNICTTDLNINGKNLAPGQAMQISGIDAMHRVLVARRAIKISPITGKSAPMPKPKHKDKEGK